MQLLASWKFLCWGAFINKVVEFGWKVWKLQIWFLPASLWKLLLSKFYNYESLNYDVTGALSKVNKKRKLHDNWCVKKNNIKTWCTALNKYWNFIMINNDESRA
jgi:hypothetical protein